MNGRSFRLVILYFILVKKKHEAIFLTQKLNNS